MGSVGGQWRHMRGGPSERRSQWGGLEESRRAGLLWTPSGGNAARREWCCAMKRRAEVLLVCGNVEVVGDLDKSFPRGLWGQIDCWADGGRKTVA